MIFTALETANKPPAAENLTPGSSKLNPALAAANSTIRSRKVTQCFPHIWDKGLFSEKCL